MPVAYKLNVIWFICVWKEILVAKAALYDNSKGTPQNSNDNLEGSLGGAFLCFVPKLTGLAALRKEIG